MPINIYKLDERANTSKFFYDNFEDEKYNLVTTVMMDFLHVAIFNEKVRQQITEQVKHNGNHLVWSANGKNVHYLARVA